MFKFLRDLRETKGAVAFVGAAVYATQQEQYVNNGGPRFVARIDVRRRPAYGSGQSVGYRVMDLATDTPVGTGSYWNPRHARALAADLNLIFGEDS